MRFISRAALILFLVGLFHLQSADGFYVVVFSIMGYGGAFVFLVISE